MRVMGSRWKFFTENPFCWRQKWTGGSMDKKPILYLSHCGSSIGGGEKQLAYLVANMDRARYQPLVVCPDDGVFVEHLRSANVPTVVLALPPWRKVKALITRHSAARKLVALAKTHNACLIHTSDSWFNPYLWSLKKRLKIPVVSHARNLLTPMQVQKYGFDQMDRIIAISEQSKTPLHPSRRLMLAKLRLYSIVSICRSFNPPL